MLILKEEKFALALVKEGLNKNGLKIFAPMPYKVIEAENAGLNVKGVTNSEGAEIGWNKSKIYLLTVRNG